MGGWYLLVLFVLLVGMTCGWALPSCVEEGERQIITQQASALLAQAASPQMPLAAMLLTAMLNALRTVGLLFVGSGVLWHCIMGQGVWHWVYAAWDAAGTWLWGLVFGLCDAGITKLSIFTKLCIFSRARWTDSGL